MTSPGAWWDRMADEREAAEAALPPGTVYAPHDGKTSDANLFAADLLAGPDEDADPTR